MYIISTFEQSVYLELVITAIEQEGVPGEKILAVPLEKSSRRLMKFDSIHRSDGLSMMDMGAIIGTVFMLLGSIYGYILPWGPIIWGIIGAVSGISIGLLAKWLWLKSKGYESKPITSETVLIIHCREDQCETMEKLLWEHKALGVSKVKRGPKLS